MLGDKTKFRNDWQNCLPLVDWIWTIPKISEELLLLLIFLIFLIILILLILWAGRQRVFCPAKIFLGKYFIKLLIGVPEIHHEVGRHVKIYCDRWWPKIYHNSRKDRFLKIMFNHLRSRYWVKTPSSSVLKKHKCEDIWKDNKKTFHQNGD